MGVYIIQSLQNLKSYKVGFSAKQNPFYRYICGGFYKNRCPSEICQKVSINDLELIYWFKNLNIQDEHKIHKHLKTLYKFYGEW